MIVNNKAAQDTRSKGLVDGNSERWILEGDKEADRTDGKTLKSSAILLNELFDSWNRVSKHHFTTLSVSFEFFELLFVLIESDGCFSAMWRLRVRSGCHQDDNRRRERKGCLTRLPI